MKIFSGGVFVLGILAVSVWLATPQIHRFNYWLSHDTNAPAVAQGYAGIVQTVVALLSLFVSIILALITRYYAQLTRSLVTTAADQARTAADQLTASTFPMLAFEFGENKTIFNNVEVSIKIHNSGGSAVRIIECAFGGFINKLSGSTTGDYRIETVMVPGFNGVFIGSKQFATANAPINMKDGSSLDVLTATRKFMLRVDCTDPTGRSRHSFVLNSDGNIIYRDAFSNDSDMT